MSIPPLVCSTPPPPDQCEDDKEPEDFDLHYSLSQDEEESYDYGDFSTFNHFQSLTSTDTKTDIPVINTIKDIGTAGETKNCEIRKEYKIDDEFGTIDVSKENKSDEDNNLEDLNLQLDQVSIIADLKDESLEEANTNDQSDVCFDKEKKTTITNVISENEDVTSDSPLPMNDYSHNSTVLNNFKEPPQIFDNVQCKFNNITTECIISDNIELSITSNNMIQSSENEQKQTIIDGNEEVALSKLKDDDFGDFEDFHFVNSEAKPVIIDNCDNPWEDKEDNQEVENDFGGFGTFKANFDEDENNTNFQQIVTKSELCSEFHGGELEQNDDDFGDFDDFKSSTVEMNTNEVQDTSPFVSMLSLQSNGDHYQFLESINKTLTSIFQQEIQASDSEFEIKLESFLCETWGHIMDTDVRQPYMITWNNSLGQKTLLKALCIDSRNILFGPKWNSNMPKYAANMSLAPLQPQKQATTSHVNQTEVTNSDKTCNKPATNWIDPFTSDGQESCSTENENTTTEARPKELDVFKTTISSKAENIPIYSNTLTIQPLRQINLPDTHIFTPTNSETPRSKTIHYDSGPSVLIPQPVIDNKDKFQLENMSQPITNIDSTLENDDEYSNFQDFKGNIDMNIIPSMATQETTTKNVISNNPTLPANIAYETQLLQPIKEPIIPTVNWPDPGEVKEVFDDFSDFISNSSRSNEKTNITADNSIERNEVFLDSDKLAVNHVISKERILNERSTLKAVDEFDDEFDTFQSALPSTKNTTLNINLSVVSNETAVNNQDQVISFNDPSKAMTEFEFNFNEKQNSSVQNIIPQTASNSNNVSKPNEIITESLSIQSSGVLNLLQPTPVSFTVAQKHKKCGQILQPLSLESYSQINWPNPGIDLQDLSKFNPVETLHSFKNDLAVNNQSKSASPVHYQKNVTHNQVADDDIWGEFVSSKPKQQQTQPKKVPVFADDDEWTDFVSNPVVKPQNGLNTISLNVHTNLKTQQSGNQSKLNQIPLDIPTLNYITPKSNIKSYNDRHFQNL